MKTPIRALLAIAIANILAGSVAQAQETAKPVFQEDGSVQVPAFELPPSELISPQAQAFMKMRARMDHKLRSMDTDATQSRKALTAMLAPQVEAMLNRYPVNVEEETVAGVPVRVVTPKEGSVKTDQVLINLHGGAFTTCWDSCSLLESAPISVAGGYKVVSVNYRMAPEAKHPAAVEDVEKVYRELLNDYDAASIGVYGCSAGGSLTAQTASWLSAHDLPQPGAIGIFGAGGVRFNAGDSAYLAAYIDGTFPAPTGEGKEPLDMTRGYFEGADMTDPVVSPALHPEVLEQFPPTLIITGTRAMDMSPAIYTNSQLIDAGKRPQMIVGEAMGHCYIYTAELPESQQAYRAITRFFEANLQSDAGSQP